MVDPTRYPLAWPAHRPRTLPRDQRYGKFAQAHAPITVSQATKRVLDEIARLGGQYPLISTNIAYRKSDGLPMSGQRKPDDPGVCVYFSLGTHPYAMACDTYDDIAQNLAAIAAHIEATRAITRYGVASADETLQAFSALPPPSGASAPVERPWRVVLGVAESFPHGLDPDDAAELIKLRYRRLAKDKHADAGGDDSVMAELNVARDAALAHIKSIAT